MSPKAQDQPAEEVAPAAAEQEVAPEVPGNQGEVSEVSESPKLQMSSSNSSIDTRGKVLVGHPETGGTQWVPEETIEEVWSALGWKRAALDEENNPYFLEEEADGVAVEEESEPATDSTS